MGKLNTKRQTLKPGVYTASLEERIALRDDVANAPSLGGFARFRLADQILAALDAQIGAGFLGSSVPMCECGSAFIQGARFCIDCGTAVPQQPAIRYCTDARYSIDRTDAAIGE